MTSPPGMVGGPCSLYGSLSTIFYNVCPVDCTTVNGKCEYCALKS